MSERTIVTLYGRTGCCLCDEALIQLEQLAPALGFTIETVDIERDDSLLARYMFEIPVIAVGDTEILRAPIGAARLEEALRAHLGVGL